MACIGSTKSMRISCCLHAANVSTCNVYTCCWEILLFFSPLVCIWSRSLRSSACYLSSSTGHCTNFRRQVVQVTLTHLFHDIVLASLQDSQDQKHTVTGIYTANTMQLPLQGVYCNSPSTKNRIKHIHLTKPNVIILVEELCYHPNISLSLCQVNGE